MGIMPDSSPYGSQTVQGPGWPNVEEEQLASAAAEYEALAAKITGTVVPQQQSQMMSIGEKWQGQGATAAMGEATTIIGGHEMNAAQATAIAMKLRAMEVTVAKTKTLANATAQATQAACEALQSQPFATPAMVQSQIMAGLSQNIADVTANTNELAGTLGVVPNIPTAGMPPQLEQAGQKAAKQGQDGSQDAMKMLSQMGQMAGQLPQMLMQIPQQMMQPLQQLSQPLQQLTSMMGGGGKEAGGKGPMPFSAFSNHPLAGGSGAGGGGGMVKAASLPGSGGVSSQTSLMAGLVGNSDVAVRPAGASTTAIGGVAPVSSGMGGGGMGMMGGRGEGGAGGTASSLAVPAPLDHDLSDGDFDDDW